MFDVHQGATPHLPKTGCFVKFVKYFFPKLPNLFHAWQTLYVDNICQCVAFLFARLYFLTFLEFSKIIDLYFDQKGHYVVIVWCLIPMKNQCLYNIPIVICLVISLQTVCHVMCQQMVSALKYLNEIKPPVIHYDLKPGTTTVILDLRKRSRMRHLPTMG